MTIAVIAGLAVFGAIACSLVARSFIAFVKVRDTPTGNHTYTPLVAVAWVAALAIIGVVVIICTAISDIGFKP